MKISRIVQVTAVASVLLGAAAVEAGRPSGGSTATSYVGEALGVLPGDRQSFAFDAASNCAVVGMSVGGERERAFYWDPATRALYDLTTAGFEASAYGVSNGVPQVVVGYERPPSTASDPRPRSYPVAWIEPLTGSRIQLDTSGAAYGVNESGTIVGSKGVLAVMWTSQAEGTYARTDLPLPVGWQDAYGTDINNQGVVLVRGTATGTYDARAMVRLADGRVVALAPLQGYPDVTANSVSDVSVVDGRNVVFVAGSSGVIWSPPYESFALRWTIDVDTGAVLETRALNMTSAMAVDSAGNVAGTTKSVTGKNSGSFWRGGVYLALKPPKGGSDGFVYGMPRTTGKTTCIAGVVTMNNWPMAVRWVVK